MSEPVETSSAVASPHSASSMPQDPANTVRKRTVADRVRPKAVCIPEKIGSTPDKTRIQPWIVGDSIPKAVKSTSLQQLAWAYLRIEILFVNICLKDIKSCRETWMLVNQGAIQTAPYWHVSGFWGFQRNLQDFKEDYDMVANRKLGINQSYLTDKRINYLWTTILDLFLAHEDVRWVHCNAIAYKLDEIDGIMKDVPRLIANVQHDGLWSEDILNQLNFKTKCLDKLQSARTHCAYEGIIRLTWDEIMATASRLEDYACDQIEVKSKRILRFSEATEVKSSIHAATLMWLSFLATIVCALPTIGLGWQYSPHISGTTKDADFWFILQSCSMQFFGTIMVMIRLRQEYQLSSHVRTYTIATMISIISCSIMAPLAYCFLPTEWSAIIGTLGGVVQIFVTLQLALLREK